jgi:AraC family transcriptional regulator
LTITTRFETTMAGIKADFDRHMTLVGTRLGELQAPMAGPPFARYHDFAADRIVVELGVPVAAAPDGLEEASGLPDGMVGVSSLPGGDVAATIHAGPYDTLPETYDRVAAWIAQHGFAPGSGPWEVYLTDPTKVADPAEYVTEVIWPLG